MRKRLLDFFNNMKTKYTNYEKETYRGTIKQIMKVRGLRTISISNFNKWSKNEDISGVHSIKLNLQDGYVNIYGYRNNGLCGNVIDNATTETYKNVYSQLMDIITHENEIPSSERRNILVRLNR